MTTLIRRTMADHNWTNRSENAKLPVREPGNANAVAVRASDGREITGQLQSMSESSGPFP
jgi:hypothetical protein